VTASLVAVVSQSVLFFRGATVCIRPDGRRHRGDHGQPCHHGESLQVSGSALRTATIWGTSLQLYLCKSGIHYE